MSGIAGKVVAITGASGGIGEATALLLAQRGARVVLGARRAPELQAVVARIQEVGGEATHVVCDVTRRADLEGLVAAAQDRFGRLDVLVGNAGIAPISRLDDLRVDDWEAMVDVNVKGVLFGIAAALPGFRAQGSGQIVTVGSTAAHRVAPTMAVYAATKMAIRAISEGLRQEAGDTLRVSVVSPGFVDTDFAAGASDPELRRRLLADRDRIAMPPEAVARAVAYVVEQPAGVDVGEVVVRPTAQA
jgi:NADP-dependent 3-hydroxy acid dehydrogenase YdfG